ncbi:unnamed protein product [Xylocopa violacea]|uniref:Uncharacterized protein n=1 Tax=Xylocopa violacea TaxID=135666 RepID=A0ABP1P119_XYLVO
MISYPPLVTSNFNFTLTKFNEKVRCVKCNSLVVLVSLLPITHTEFGRRYELRTVILSCRFGSSCVQRATESAHVALNLPSLYSEEYRACASSINAVARLNAGSISPYSYTSSSVGVTYRCLHGTCLLIPRIISFSAFREIVAYQCLSLDDG